MPFPYKTVLITGATSGIGLALAERMIAGGSFVIAVGRRKDRLEHLVAKHGADKVAGEAFDIADLAAMPGWVKQITTKYPSLSCIVLNAGFQRTIDFTHPESVDLDLHTLELNTNYLSPLHMTTLFLPHLISLNSPNKQAAEKLIASIILVSSGLSIFPFPRCANYSASKAAIHSLAWSLRTQLSSPHSPATQHIRVIELLPPAVQTELHTQQEDLVKLGQDKIGLTLEAYMNETWAELDKGHEEIKDEIINSAHGEALFRAEAVRKTGFEGFMGALRKMGVKI
ncbi:putative oxidoreductase DltE [Rhypophila decipiens]|uniref:Oxidoreductase DltE n=1 Tax=Rhypophila decipiens TaxID=261697 RepID=A0AAN6Y2L3_9PEZI|nr:putative oxidoreductase DltE [Rhypophila decipiens]